MNSTPLPARSLERSRAIAFARYHGFARAYVVSQPPFASLAQTNTVKPSAGTPEYWRLSLWAR